MMADKLIAQKTAAVHLTRIKKALVSFSLPANTNYL